MIYQNLGPAFIISSLDKSLNLSKFDLNYLANDNNYLSKASLSFHVFFGFNIFESIP